MTEEKKYVGKDRRQKRRGKDNGWRSWVKDYGLIVVAVSGGMWLGALQATQVWAGEQRKEIKAEQIEVRKLLREQAKHNGAIDNALKVQATQNRLILGIFLRDPQAVKDFIEKAKKGNMGRL